MKNSLAARFAIIIATFLLSVWVALTPPNLGIDLAGGTSLLYELDLSKIPSDSNESHSELAARVIDVLKKRVDPLGQKNMIWRVVGGKRIQIQMPMASEATQRARKEAQEAREALEASSLKMSQVLAAIRKPAAERDAAMAELAPPGTEQYDGMKALAEAHDRREKVRAEIAALPLGQAGVEVQRRKYEADRDYDAAYQKLNSANVDMAKLRSLLAAAENPKNLQAQKELAALPAQHPRQKDQIQKVIETHLRQVQLSGGGVEDPSELQRLVTAAGVLDFRIAVQSSEIGGPGGEEYQAAITSLRQYGPKRQVTANGTKARWFQIDPNGRDNFHSPNFVVAEWATQPYVLCYDDSFRTLTHSDEAKKAWSVRAGTPYADPSTGGGLVLPFSLDGVGAKYMGDLTSNNRNRPMAILLDDRAMSAPNINDTITSNGVITFGQATAGHPLEAIRKEADQLKQIMDAGSLPATLQKQPISVQEISADMGADNIKSGLWSGIYAVIAVMIFMLIYYTITGLFANIALFFNLILVMAVMAFLKGTYTLPGIAGLVLTLGMAVDANVLINERIREELHKGASLWMAIKQGYDKVFWTIFDANLTTSLTSIVLIYVGSEEVKGFGVTLLIGLTIHMFTALFVTRTMMMAAVRWGIIRQIDDNSVREYFHDLVTFSWLRGRWPFMRVITVSNIDWIGKRYYFWAISAAITVAGFIAFFARGDDKYDIEFRGGTQVTFTLKQEPGTPPLTLDQVRDRITGMYTLPGLKDIQSARVYHVGPPSEHTYQMQTTINNPQGDPSYVHRVLLEPLKDRFADVIELQSAVRIARDDQDRIGDLQDSGIVVPITDGSLERVFAKAGVEGIPNEDVTNFATGTAIRLENITPPQSIRQLRDRITNTRQSTRISTELRIPYRDFQIIPVAFADGAGASTQPGAMENRPLTRAIMVSVDPAIPYDESSEGTWQSEVAQSEWLIVREAMANESSFPITTFDPVVADQAKQQALVAVILALVLIVAYVWVRFGGLVYGIGAIISLAHDATVALCATVLAGVVHNAVFGGHPNWLLLADFKINLTMIAAYLTIIGYSINDTIVIFDRVRELRGRSTAPLSAKLVNDAINQCMGRTIWTSFTVFVVLMIMYIWGGEGIRGFSFAMLVGVITGVYSTLAIASPMLLITEKAGGPGGPTGGGARKPNPFLKKSDAELPEAAPAVFKPNTGPNMGPNVGPSGA